MILVRILIGLSTNFARSVDSCEDLRELCFGFDLKEKTSDLNLIWFELTDIDVFFVDL